MLTKRTESFSKYLITEDGPVEWQVTTFEYEPRIAFAGGLAIENYKNIDLGTGNILLRKTIVEKEENKLADLSKQTTIVYQAWGATAAGKTVAAIIMGALKRAEESDRISGTYTLVDRMSVLVCSGIEKTINIGRGTAPAQPTALDQQNERLRGAQDRLDSNGPWNATGPKGSPSEQLTDLSFGSDGTNSTDRYDMEFAPDSYLRPSTDAGDNGTGLNYVYVSSQAAAYEYGRAIYAILSGMANGKSITTELRNLPSEPMGTLYLEAAGTVGRFRANGTTFAFDSQGLIAGCDAMLDGGAGKLTGASGTNWFPLMVAASNLPTVTTTTNSTPGLANTINAPGGFDPMAPGNIWASFGTAGVEGDVYAVELTRASVVPAMQENVRRESVSRSLSWVLEAPYSLTTSTESITSVSVSYGTASVVNELLVGSGSGVIANLSAEMATLQLLAGSGSGVISDLTPAMEASYLFAGSGSGVIADLFEETLELFAGSGSGVITETSNPNFSSVSVQLHFAGSNNSTTFTDSSGNNLATSSVVNAKISTDQSKFGGSSGLFANGIQYIRYTPQALLEITGDFTIEAQLYPLSSVDMIAASSASDNNTQIFRLNEGGSGRLSFYLNGTQVFSPTAAGITANAWQHVAICRSGSSTRMFANGTQIGGANTSWTGSFRIDVIGAFFFQGSPYGDDGFNGHIDELRVTKGVAIYTANFAPPTGPFPDS